MGDTNGKAACIAESGMNKGFQGELLGGLAGRQQEPRRVLFIRNDGLLGKKQHAV